MYQPSLCRRQQNWTVLLAEILLIFSTVSAIQERECPYLIFARGGASGNLPEHTLGAYAAALAMGVDFIATDLVITKDGQLVARHDNHLTLTTDVGEHPEFANRYRAAEVDGSNVTGWFVEDFTLEELKTLRAVESMPEIRPNNARLNRAFPIATFEEILSLVRAMERTLKRQFGLSVEIKHSTYFKSKGLPMEQSVVDLLRQYGFKRENVYIESFEITNLKQLRNTSEYQLIQLYDEKEKRPYDQVHLGSNLTYGSMATKEGLAEVAKYANAVAPKKNYIISSPNGKMGSVTSFVDHAHASRLLVLPFAFQAENYFLPAKFRSPDNLNAAIGDLSSELKVYLKAGIDGVFTDNANVAIRDRGLCKSDLGRMSQMLNPAMAVKTVGEYIYRSWDSRRRRHRKDKRRSVE